jgi:hypothetical protein
LSILCEKDGRKLSGFTHTIEKLATPFSCSIGLIGELEKRAFRLRHLGVIIANEGHPQREAAVDEEATLLGWFSEQFDVLVEKFKPSLQLKSRWL